MVQRLAERIDYLDQAVTGLLAVLPLLLFLWLTRRSALREGRLLGGNVTPLAGQESLTRYRQGTWLLLAFHFGLYGLLAVQELLYVPGRLTLGGYRIFSPSSWLVVQTFGSGASMQFTGVSAPTEFRFELGRSLFVVLLATAALIWPVFVGRREIAAGTRTRGRIRRLATAATLLLFLAVPVIIGLGLAANHQLLRGLLGGLRSGPLGSVVLVGVNAKAQLAVGLVFPLVLLLVARIVSRVLPGLSALTVVTCGTGLYALVLLFSPEAPSHLYAKIVVSLTLTVGAALSIAFFLRAAYLAIVGRPIHDAKWYSDHRWVRRGLAVLILVIAFPTQLFSSSRSGSSIYQALLPLDNLIPYLFIVMLLLGLRDLHRDSDGAGMVAEARTVGLLIAATAFFSPASRFLIFPVSLLLGVTLMMWLLTERQVDRLRPVLENESDPAKIVRGVIDIRSEERQLRQALKIGRQMVAKGERTPADQRKLIAELKRGVKRAKSSLGLREDDDAVVALGLGPEGSPWARGKQAAGRSLLLSLPWIALYVADLFHSPALTGDFVSLQLIASLAYVVFAWALYGFVFGYFYPYIRGRTGLEKGVLYGVVLILPRLVLALLSTPLGFGAWKPTLAWAAQVLLNSVLLGLVVGDYEMLKRANLRFRDLLEIHRLRPVTAGASALIAAISTALTAVLTSQVTNLAAAWLGYLIPKGKSPMPPPPAKMK